VGDQTFRRSEVARLLDLVGLPERARHKFPHEFSGGQKQRIGIARAIALKPKLLVCDEPVSALDVSIQSQILNLLLELQQEMGLSYVFIAHDLSVVRHVSDRVAVMYLGRIIEEASADEIYRAPRHPYTKALIDAIPVPDPGRKRETKALTGDVPSPIAPPPGCHFHGRCPKAEERCRIEYPKQDGDEAHRSACHYPIM
jgi:peptide/nickel transport system ATP-binding protein